MDTLRETDFTRKESTDVVSKKVQEITTRIFRGTPNSERSGVGYKGRGRNTY